jgi:lipopolysaccharide/colanic/teichoic acid biosynthesis glycosyltransferase
MIYIVLLSKRKSAAVNTTPLKRIFLWGFSYETLSIQVILLLLISINILCELLIKSISRIILIIFVYHERKCTLK